MILKARVDLALSNVIVLHCLAIAFRHRYKFFHVSDFSMERVRFLTMGVGVETMCAGSRG